MSFEQEILENEKIAEYMDSNLNTPNEELVNQALGRKLTQEELKAVEWQADQNSLEQFGNFGLVVPPNYYENAVRSLIVMGHIPNILRCFKRITK